MNPLRENRAKHKLQRREIVTCIGGMNLMTSEVIDYIGQFGFDAAWIETEHGPFDFADIPDMTRACDLWGMTSVVRVNSNDYGTIYRTFDVGAQGVCVPHVNTAEEAQAAVEAAKYHPLGKRGMYSTRQAYGRTDYVARANDETMLTVLIEDIVAVENLSEILKVDHIDVFHVAPSDLAQSMGYPEPPIPPNVREVERKAIEQIVASGRVAGATVAGSISVEEYIEMGARFVFAQWPQWIASGAKSYLDTVKSAADKMARA